MMRQCMRLLDLTVAGLDEEQAMRDQVERPAAQDRKSRQNGTRLESTPLVAYQTHRW